MKGTGKIRPFHIFFWVLNYFDIENPYQAGRDEKEMKQLEVEVSPPANDSAWDLQLTDPQLAKTDKQTYSSQTQVLTTCNTKKFSDSLRDVLAKFCQVTDTETDNTALYTIKNLITNMQMSCASPNQYKSYVVHYQSVCRYRTTLWTLICMFVVNHKNTIDLYTVCACALRTKSVQCFACSLWPFKKSKMLGATPTSHGHRPPLCTMVHNAARWYTTQVGGSQHSPVPTRWCST